MGSPSGLTPTRGPSPPAGPPEALAATAQPAGPPPGFGKAQALLPTPGPTAHSLRGTRRISGTSWQPKQHLGPDTPPPRRCGVRVSASPGLAPREPSRNPTRPGRDVTEAGSLRPESPAARGASRMCAGGRLSSGPPHFLQDRSQIKAGPSVAGSRPPPRPKGPHRLPQRKSRFCTAGTVEPAFWPVTRWRSSTTCTASGWLAAGDPEGAGLRPLLRQLPRPTVPPPHCPPGAAGPTGGLWRSGASPRCWPLRSTRDSAPRDGPGLAGADHHGLVQAPHSPLKQAPASFAKSSTIRGRWAKPGARTSSYTEGCGRGCVLAMLGGERPQHRGRWVTRTGWAGGLGAEPFGGQRAGGGSCSRPQAPHKQPWEACCSPEPQARLAPCSPLPPLCPLDRPQDPYPGSLSSGPSAQVAAPLSWTRKKSNTPQARGLDGALPAPRGWNADTPTWAGDCCPPQK